MIKMNQGIIDIGSNTVRLNVYRIENQSFELLFSKKASIGLVSYVKKRTLSQEGIQVLTHCLNQFISMMHALQVHHYRAFATASLRNLQNTDEVLSILKDKWNINVELLSGEQEGQYSFLGATHHLHSQHGMYVDSGGASSEIVIYQNQSIQYVTSLPIGSLNLYNKYVSSILPTKEEYKKMKEVCLKHLKSTCQERKFFKTDTLAITGGSMRAIRTLLRSIHFIDEDDIEFSVNVLDNLESYLFEDIDRAAHLILKVKPDRIHTLICGLAIIKTLAEYAKTKTIQVSLYGLREGYLIGKIMGGSYDKKEI